jgi:hypothetical protein
MPQMVVRPFMARTMVEAAYGVKVRLYSAKRLGGDGTPVGKARSDRVT